MTFLVSPPKPAAVRVDEQGAPTHLDAYPLVGDLERLQRWLADVDWWSRPVSREYWKVLLRGQLLCEIYRDLLAEDSWFIERVDD